MKAQFNAIVIPDRNKGDINVETPRWGVSAKRNIIYQNHFFAASVPWK